MTTTHHEVLTAASNDDVWLVGAVDLCTPGNWKLGKGPRSRTVNRQVQALVDKGQLRQGKDVTDGRRPAVVTASGYVELSRAARQRERR